MNKGIVFEIEDGKATVMKSNGTFICVVARSNWRKGDVVTIKAINTLFKTFVTVAACFLFLISVAYIGGEIYFDETTIISLDVNPSIELSVNRFDRVIAVRSLNDEGAHIIEQVNVKNKLFDKAISTLMDGGVGVFIVENAWVTFTVFSSNPTREKFVLDKVQNAADNYISSHHVDTHVEVLAVAETVINEAHEYNITAGKYTALCKLQEVLPEIELDNYSHHSINYIKEQTKIHRNGHQHKGKDKCTHH